MGEISSLTKFMQVLKPPVETQLRRLAKQRSITLQELIRAVIIPEWLKVQNLDHNPLKTGKA